MSDAEVLRYRPVARSIRPPRAVTLVCSEGDWRSDVLRMLECYGRTWGGDGNGLVACSSAGEIAEAFWPLLAALDADHWAIFQRTPRGLRLSDPAAYEAQLAAAAANWVAEHGGSEQDAREALESDIYLSGPHATLPTPLDERIRRQLAPLASFQVAVHAAYKADEPPPHGLVDMCELTYRPRRVAQLDIRSLLPAMRLLAAAKTGAMAPRHLEVLEGSGAVDWATVLVAPDELPQLLELAWTGQVDTAMRKVTDRLLVREDDPPVPDFAAPQFLADTPLAHTRLGCEWYTRLSPDLYREPVVVVCGESAEDFCYAYTRQRVVGGTCWLPVTPGADDEEFATVLYETLARVLPRLVAGQAGDRPVLLSSLTLKPAQLDQVLAALSATVWGRGRINTNSPHGALSVQVCAPEELPARRNTVLLDKVHFSDLQQEPFLGAELARNIEIPLPSQAVGRSADACRWQVDVEATEHILPARWALQPVLTVGGALTPWAVRSSTSGISVDSHGRAFTFGGSPLSQMLVQARLRFPPATEIFSALLAGSGATLKESDKGRYTRRMIELWEGLDALAADLRSTDTGDLLAAWATSTVDGDLGRTHQGRKYLRLSDAAQIADLSETQARALLDRYQLRSIVSRGLLLRCALCAGTSFYRLEDLGPGFRCQRCRQHNEISRAAWNGPEEPQWFYGLDEVAYQGLRANIHVPLLALAELSKGSRSVLHMPEAVVHRPGADDIEVDIWAVIDGRIVIGEAKKSNQLETSDRKERQRCATLRELARELSADEFVMATEGDGWAERTRANVQRTIGSATTVRWLTGLSRPQT